MLEFQFVFNVKFVSKDLEIVLSLTVYFLFNLKYLIISNKQKSKGAN